MKRPKTPASRAQVPLAPFAVAALKRWRVEQAAERLAHPAWTGWQCECGDRKPRSRDIICGGCGRPLKPDLVVFSQPSGRPVDPRRDWQDWQDILKAAGLPPSRVHDLRHALGTLLLEQGQDVRVVQELLRHSNPNTTRSIYQHVRQRLKAQGADVIERAYGGNPASGATTRTI